MALKWKWDKNCMGLISHSFSKSGATENSGETLVFWSRAIETTISGVFGAVVLLRPQIFYSFLLKCNKVKSSAVEIFKHN
jgi:hypothetical protein